MSFLAEQKSVNSHYNKKKQVITGWEINIYCFVQSDLFQYLVIESPLVITMVTSLILS